MHRDEKSEDLLKVGLSLPVIFSIGPRLASALALGYMRHAHLNNVNALNGVRLESKT